MKIELNEYGLNISLDEAVKLLRCTLCDKLPKKNRQAKVAEALGIIETVNRMAWVSDPEEYTEGDTE